MAAWEEGWRRAACKTILQLSVFTLKRRNCICGPEKHLADQAGVECRAAEAERFGLDVG